MSTVENKRAPEGGRLRAAGTRAVRPRNAATLIIVRRDRKKPQVLMGKRHSGHDFMPNLWVFPGGRIDRSDFRAPFATDLKADVAARFEAHIPMARGRALALTAIRETFEEAGLLLAKRFDTWFLMADAERLVSLDRQPDCGELEEVAWVDFDEAIALPLPSVTRTVIGEAIERLDNPSRPQPFMRFGAAKTRLSHL